MLAAPAHQAISQHFSIEATPPLAAGIPGDAGAKVLNHPARATELEIGGPVTIYVRTEIAQPRNPALLCFTDRGHPAKPYDPIKGGQNDDTR